jgi:ABC-type phosphate/phosphonate transport system substrate-binding protein
MPRNRAGLDVKKDFVTLPWAKRHDNVITAVANGEADVGATREDDLEKMAGKVDVAKLKIIGYTDYFPNYVVFSATKLDAGRTEKVRAALLRLKPNGAEALSLLSAPKFAGFVPTVEKDFASLLEAMKVADAL